MRLRWILILILIFIIQIYMAIRAYANVNLGKEKGEMKEVNRYIYFTLGSTAIITFSTILIF